MLLVVLLLLLLLVLVLLLLAQQSKSSDPPACSRSEPKNHQVAGPSGKKGIWPFFLLAWARQG